MDFRTAPQQSTFHPRVILFVITARQKLRRKRDTPQHIMRAIKTGTTDRGHEIIQCNRGHELRSEDECGSPVTREVIISGKACDVARGIADGIATSRTINTLATAKCRQCRERPQQSCAGAQSSQCNSLAKLYCHSEYSTAKPMKAGTRRACAAPSCASGDQHLNDERWSSTIVDAAHTTSRSVVKTKMEDDFKGSAKAA